jgi:PAS domain S-box-containing protein
MRTVARQLAVAEELARMGSWVFDIESRTAVWSEGMYRILGLPPAKKEYRGSELFELVHADDRERMQRLLAEVTARPEAVPEAGIEHALRMVRADGSVRELRAVGKVDQDERGPALWLGAVQDITEAGSGERDLRAGHSAPRPLTEREIEVLLLAAEGISGPAIAKQLVLSPHTVRTHFEHIYEKLGVGDRTAAVAHALRAGLIH